MVQSLRRHPRRTDGGYVRDMTYDEDRSQVRTRNAPHNMTTLRNLAIGLLRRQKFHTISRAVAHMARHPDHVADLLGCP